jgi:hypothetical protein
MATEGAVNTIFPEKNIKLEISKQMFEVSENFTKDL